MIRPRSHLFSLIPASAFALVLSVICGAAGAARAADNDPFDPMDLAMKESYRKAIEDGVAEYDAGHFQEALSCFRHAHQLSPNARTFRGMGKAYFELRDYVAAIRNLSEALKDLRKPLSDEQREEVQDLLERSRLFVAIYSLKLSPPDARITVDGEPPELQSDGSLMMGLGLHTLEIRAQGHQWRTISLNVRGGEREPLVLRLEPLAPVESVVAPAPATKPAPAPAPARAHEPEPEESLTTDRVATKASTSGDPSPKNLTSIMWFAGASASALLAIGAGVYWGVQNSYITKCRNPEDDGPTCDNESDLLMQRNAGIVVTLVTGAAAVAMTTVGILTWKSEPAQPTRTSLACGLGPFIIACSGAF